jgi:F0F1-type ATP synthase membrane subunit a
MAIALLFVWIPAHGAGRMGFLQAFVFLYLTCNVVNYFIFVLDRETVL